MKNLFLSEKKAHNQLSWERLQYAPLSNSQNLLYILDNSLIWGG